MAVTNILAKLKNGVPYFSKEIRNMISEKTPFFISKPSSIYIWWSTRCNGLCVMCPTGIDNAAGKKYHPNNHTPDELLVEKMSEIKKLSGEGVLCSLIAGEPLLYKNIFPLMEQSNKLGIDFNFTTNGYLLKQKTVEKILELEPFSVGVSLESLDPAINEIIRPFKNGTKLTVEGIDRLLSEKEKRNSKTSINIKITLSEINHHSVIDMVKRYGKIKGVMITPQPFELLEGIPREVTDMLKIKDIDGLKKTINELIALKKEGYSINADKNNLLDMVSRVEHNSNTNPFDFERKNSKRETCTIGNTHLFLHSSGDIRLCPEMEPIGNLNDDVPLEELWQGGSAREVRKKISKCDALCTLSCTRKTSIWDKMVLFLRR